MIGNYEISLELTDTTPGGLVQATVAVESGTLSMDRSWAPAVRAQVAVKFAAFDLASWQMIDPTLQARFARLVIVDNIAGRQAQWHLNLRGYRHDVKAGLVYLDASSYETLVQDYGRSTNSANFTDTAAYPTTLSIVRDLCQIAAGADVAPVSDWTAAEVGTPGPSNEYRFVVPGSALWTYVQGLAAHTPGGIVQHYGYATNVGDSVAWLLTHPAYERIPGFAYTVPAEPNPDLGPAEGSAELYEWQAERSRDAEGWGDAMYLEFPGRQTAGSATFTTSGYVFDYEYDERGTAGSTSAKRRQATATSGAYSTPDPGAARDAVAAQRLDRVRLRAVGQTYTQALDVRLLPWQVHQDENSVSYMIGTITHNLGGGTSVVTVNRM